MRDVSAGNGHAGPALRPLADARRALGRLPGRLFRATRDVVPRPARFTMDGVVASLTGNPTFIRHLDLSAGLRRRQRNPRDLFIGWLLSGGWSDGAARVHGLYAHGHFRRIGVNSVLLRASRYSSSTLTLRQPDIERIVAAQFDVVVFQNLSGVATRRVAQALREAGTRTVYVTGDLVGADMAGAVDWIVGGSEGLRSIAGSRRDRSSVIESVLDCPPDMVKDYSRPQPDDRIRVAWVGYPENLHLLAPVRAALADPRLSRFDLVTISRGPGVTHQWHRSRVWSQLLACDIAVLPSADTDWYRVKPNTRMTMFKSLGIPIVASPLASYVATLTHGRGCYFARTPEEWADALLALADPEHRREMGFAERDRILATYGIEAHGRKWLNLFYRLTGRREHEPAHERIRQECAGAERSVRGG